MQNYKYNKVTTEKFNIKGELSDDCKTIKYINGDKEEQEISLIKCFEKFVGTEIALSIMLKTDEDLSDEFEDEE
jgi:hypothetical protein